MNLMKSAVLATMIAWVIQTAHGQGQLVLYNVSNSSTNPSAPRNGLFWLSTGGTPALINQDFNAAFYAGTDSSSLSPLATFLLANGTAVGDNAGGPGTFVDQAGRGYTFASSTFVFLQIQAWTGNFDSYAAAVSGGAAAAQSPIFANRVDVPPGSPAELTGMPGIILTVPEPATFALVGFGAICFLLFWQRRPRSA